jgi:hypothetical protein
VHLEIVSFFLLQGELPGSLIKLKKLTHFSLKNTRVNGHLPTAIGDMVSLTFFEIFGSLVDGEIPQSICLLKDLEYLFLAQNSLVGIFNYQV